MPQTPDFGEMLNFYDAPKTTFSGHNLHKRNLIFIFSKVKGVGTLWTPPPLYKNLLNNFKVCIYNT